MRNFKKILQSIYHHLYLKKREEIPFIIFATFLFGFVFTRLFVFAFWDEIINGMALNIRNTHIHHFNYGILLIVITGFVALTNREFTDRHVRKMATVFGLGLAIMLDEFAMWIKLDDSHYWSKTNYNAIFAAILIFVNIIYFRGFWKVIGRRTVMRLIHKLRYFAKK